MSLTNKAPKDFYKDLTYIENNNNGFDNNIDNLRSGNGNLSSLYLSNNNLKVKPSTDNTTLVNIVDVDGNSLFTVDSTNDSVKSGITQTHVNTNYAYFANSSVGTAQFPANTHHAILFGGSDRSNYLSRQRITLGTGTDPDTSYTVTTAAAELVGRFWYITDKIVIDKACFWVGASTDTGDTVRCHLMSYDIDVSNGATGGDLSNGVVVASSSDIVNEGQEQSYFNNMTIDSSSVTANKALLFTFRQDSTNADYSIAATIKYHVV